MATLDLRRSLNAISDVVNNRPRPLREFDQIFMKTADVLLQTEHVGRLFEGKRVIFYGLPISRKLNCAGAGKTRSSPAEASHNLFGLSLWSSLACNVVGKA
jgi:hypothetical protein